MAKLFRLDCFGYSPRNDDERESISIWPRNDDERDCFGIWPRNDDNGKENKQGVIK